MYVVREEYYLEDTVQMLDFTPTPGLRKGRGGRDEDEGDALLDKEDKEVFCPPFILFRYTRY